jgi:hypothetical protein
VAAFVVIAISLPRTARILSLLLLGNILPGSLAELLILLGTAALLTGAADGRPAVRVLFPPGVPLEGGTGLVGRRAAGPSRAHGAHCCGHRTFHPPAGGWEPLLGNYLLNTLIIGAQLGNIWEELAWTAQGIILGCTESELPISAEDSPVRYSRPLRPT